MGQNWKNVPYVQVPWNCLSKINSNLFSLTFAYTLIAGYTNIFKLTHTVQLVIGCEEQIYVLVKVVKKRVGFILDYHLKQRDLHCYVTIFWLPSHPSPLYLKFPPSHTRCSFLWLLQIHTMIYFVQTSVFFDWTGYYDYWSPPLLYDSAEVV